MRFIRFAALFGSLVLLVTTAVSVVNRRDDIRDDQAVRVEQSSLLVSQAIRDSITRLRQDVHLAATAASDPTLDDRALADELVRFVPGAEVCVTDVAGCTDANLWPLREISDLSDRSERVDTQIDGVAALAQVGVDDASMTLLVVRSVSTDSGDGLVAMRVPVRSLVSTATSVATDSNDVAIDVATRIQNETNTVDAALRNGGMVSISETIGSPFVFGALVVTVETSGAVGLAGDDTARYATLLALGTVLLALAGWTFLVERRKLEKRATTDALTDLINRREFERVSEAALDMADRFNTGLCVMVIDLNGFKQINDARGHQYGDLVLTASAERLVEAVRDTDVVGRWGGDEFVILLPGLAERTAVRNSAERIWNRLADSPVVGDTSMTASIGAAIFPRHGTALDALLRAADVAMYEAKTTGVSHRIADTIEVNESLLSDSPADDGPSSPDAADSTPKKAPIVSDTYVGADRRRSLVAPSPQLAGASPPPSDDTSAPAPDPAES